MYVKTAFDVAKRGTPAERLQETEVHGWISALLECMTDFNGCESMRDSGWNLAKLILWNVDEGQGLSDLGYFYGQTTFGL